MLKQIEERVKRLLGAAGCSHDGETGQYCGRCGADMRPVTGFECAVCSILGHSSYYPLENSPAFCRKCGAPGILFKKSRKRRPNNLKMH